MSKAAPCCWISWRAPMRATGRPCRRPTQFRRRIAGWHARQAHRLQSGDGFCQECRAAKWRRWSRRRRSALPTSGAHVEQVDPPGGDPVEISRPCGGRARDFFSATRRRRKKRCSIPAWRRWRRRARRFPSAAISKPMSRAAPMPARCACSWRRSDFLLTPSLAVTAFDVGKISPYADDSSWPSWTPFSYPFNLTQQPAASVPCGRTRAGLPVGLQIVGPAVMTIGACCRRPRPMKAPIRISTMCPRALHERRNPQQ